MVPKVQLGAMTQTNQEVRLKIVEEGLCHPYRQTDLAVMPEPREEAICVQCRHCIEKGHHTDLEWRYECRMEPQYEEHRNFVNGEAMFFDRGGWGKILEYRRKRYEWADEKNEKDYFYASQSYGSCMKTNTDGQCENFERPVAMKKQLATEGRLWPLYARAGAVGTVLGLLTGALE